MSEIAILLQEIGDHLEPMDAEAVGSMELSGETLSLCDGKLKLTASLRDEPNSPPSMAHVHVISTAEEGVKGGFCLDACMIGISTGREEALKQAGRNWVNLAAGPTLSLIHGKPVLNAEPFEGTEKWGIRRCRGFLGPLMVRMLDRPDDTSDADELGEANFFDYVSELAPAGVYHLAKAVVQADPEQGWIRSIEIDGHEVSYTDSAWNDSPSPPKQRLIGSRFATFHYADQAEHVASRTKLDETIRTFVSYCQKFDYDTDQVAETMVSEEYESELVDRLIFMLPLAFGRNVLGNLDVALSPFYIDVTKKGYSTELLMHDVPYARSLAIGAELSQSEQSGAFKRLALLSSEVSAANKAIRSNCKLEDLELLPPVVPGPGVDQDDVDRAVQAAIAKMEAEKESVENNHSKKRSR